MKRILFFLIIFSVFALPLLAQSKKKLKELKVKSKTENTTLYIDGKANIPFKSGYSTFDGSGNTTTEIEYNQNGTIKKKQTIKYAGKEKIEEIIEQPNTDPIEVASNDKKYKKTTWKYNAAGDKTEEVIVDMAGAIIKKTTFTYNSKGNKTEEIEYNAGTTLIQKSKYFYDTKGLRTEKKVWGPGDILIKQVKYTYTY